jgi:hypothetical protein
VLIAEVPEIAGMLIASPIILAVFVFVPASIRHPAFAPADADEILTFDVAVKVLSVPPK